MAKKEEQARESGYYDAEKIGYDYNPDLAETESGELKIKRGGRMVSVAGDSPKAESAQTAAAPAKPAPKPVETKS